MNTETTSFMVHSVKKVNTWCYALNTQKAKSGSMRTTLINKKSTNWFAIVKT